MLVMKFGGSSLADAGRIRRVADLVRRTAGQAEVEMPVVVVSVLLAPATLTVPPPVAVKAGLALVVRAMLPLGKLITAPNALSSPSLLEELRS